MRYPSTKNLAGYYRTRAGAVVIISDDAFYTLFSGIV